VDIHGSSISGHLVEIILTMHRMAPVPTGDRHPENYSFTFPMDVHRITTNALHRLQCLGLRPHCSPVKCIVVMRWTSTGTVNECSQDAVTGRDRWASWTGHRYAVFRRPASPRCRGGPQHSPCATGGPLGLRDCVVVFHDMRRRSART